MIELNRLFNVNYYASRNPQLGENGVDTPEELVSHFFNFGLEEGRDFSPFVDLDFYATSNPELEAVGLDTRSELFEHLQTEGIARGWRFSPFIDLSFYQENNSELQSLGNDFEALFRNLQDTGIDLNLPFVRGLDLDAYLAANPEINQTVGGSREGAFTYIATFGTEGRPGVASSLDVQSSQIQTALQLIGDIARESVSGALAAFAPTSVLEFPGNTAFVSPNEIVDTNLIPYAGTWFGNEPFNQGRTVGEFFRLFAENLELSNFQPLDIFQDGNRVVARVNIGATVGQTGLPFNFDQALILDLADGSDRGKIDELEFILDTHEMGEAFAGEVPSDEAREATIQDPLTGEFLSVNPDADPDFFLETVRDFYERITTLDPEREQIVAPDGVFVVPGDPAVLPFSGVARGDEVFTRLLNVNSLGRTLSVFQPSQFIANGDRVAAIVNVESNMATGIPIESKQVHFLTVGDNGLINNGLLIADSFSVITAVTGELPFA